MRANSSRGLALRCVEKGALVVLRYAGKSIVLMLMAITTACGASLPSSAAFPRPHEQAAIEAAIQSWQMAELPWASACQEQLARIRVVISGPEEFTELCGRRLVHAGGKLYACNTEQYEQVFPFMLIDGDRIPLLVISRLQPEEHQWQLIIHESMHWLERCSDKGIDYDHEDMRVWQGARYVARRLLDEKETRYRMAYRKPASSHALAAR